MNTTENNGNDPAVYDGIILGAGHNSLVLQAYLSKAGLRVLCLERKPFAGGGMTTMEAPGQPGFFHNTHGFFCRGIDRMPWYEDLELDRHGARAIQPELNAVLIMPDGRTLEWWTDFEKTAASFAGFSARDAATLRRWHDDFLPVVEKILIPESQSPPLPPGQRRKLMERSPEGRLLLEVSALSPMEFVQREFENPTIKAGLLFFNGLREVDLRCKGFGHHIAMLLASSGKAQMMMGGSASLARALVSAVEEHGGEIRLNTDLKNIVIENGRAVGVETADGSQYQARHFVASCLNPHQTYLELIDTGAMPAQLRTKAEKFQYNLVAPLFGLYLNLKEPPRYKASEKNPHIDKAFMVILGLVNIEQYPEIVRHHQNGTIPRTVMWGTCPTQFDPSQAPAGSHAAFMWEKLPYRLNGNPENWDREKDAHGTEMLDLWKTFAPNLESAVISSFTRSPLDVEREFPNMREGDLLIGAFTNGQIGYNRPFTGAGHYRAGIDGLYLCGSSSHPGGNITGLPGYNAAQVILSDLAINQPWMPDAAETRIKKLLYANA